MGNKGRTSCWQAQKNRRAGAVEQPTACVIQLVPSWGKEELKFRKRREKHLGGNETGYPRWTEEKASTPKKLDGLTYLRRKRRKGGKASEKRGARFKPATEELMIGRGVIRNRIYEKEKNR